ncbi:MAG: hypothetical protein ACKVKP_13870 [Acidimicrobiales bacterium]
MHDKVTFISTTVEFVEANILLVAAGVGGIFALQVLRAFGYLAMTSIIAA